MLVMLKKFKAFLTGKPKSPVMISCIYGEPRRLCIRRTSQKRFGFRWMGRKSSFRQGIRRQSFRNLVTCSERKQELPMLPDPIPVGAGVLVDAFREVLGIELDRRFPIMMSRPPGTIEIFVGYR